MPGPDPTDAELVTAARGGDKAAFAVLVDRHRALAHAVCLRLLRRPELASDAVQEATVVAIIGLDRLREPDRFGSWLCGIAVNVVRQWLRHAGRDLDAGFASELVDPTPGPEDVVVEEAEARRVRDAVAELAPGQRDAVTLYYLAELPGREVAEALGISPGATKTRLHKARAALRRELAGEMEVDRVSTVDETPIEMRVAEVRREPPAATPVRRHVIVLEEQAGDRRRLPIFVGAPEATAAALHLVGADTPRPLTHLLLVGVIEALGARVAEVRVTRLANEIFYGEIALDGPGGRVDVDARPSDAVNLALLADAPIRVAPGVIGAVSASGRVDGDTALDELTEGTQQIADEWLAQMAAVHRLIAPDVDE